MVNPRNYDKILILTGAGISAGSGLETYRGPGGLWEKHGIAPEATKEVQQSDPWAVWKLFYTAA